MAYRKIQQGENPAIYSMEDDNLAEQTKIYYEAFCCQFVLDFNARLALVRLGVPPKTAATKAKTILKEPYVANYLQKLYRQLRPQDFLTRTQVMAALWKEANDPNNEGGTRVAALKHLGQMLGCFQAAPETAGSKGVMLVPVVNVDSWEVTAQAQQAKLKQDASS